MSDEKVTVAEFMCMRCGGFMGRSVAAEAKCCGDYAEPIARLRTLLARGGHHIVTEAEKRVLEAADVWEREHSNAAGSVTAEMCADADLKDAIIIWRTP